MGKPRDLANLISTGNPLADGAIAASEVSGLATVATSGAYSDVTGTPSLAAVATSGAVADVTGAAPLASPTFTGDVTLPDKIVHTGDTNTAIRFPAADTVAFETGGSERFRFGSSGQLGIGGATYGTSGQVLTSGGASAAPTWADAGGGVHTEISNVTISNNTSYVDFTGLTDGSHIFYLYNVKVSADASFIMQIYNAANGSLITSAAAQAARGFGYWNAGSSDVNRQSQHDVRLNNLADQDANNYGLTATVHISGFYNYDMNVVGHYQTVGNRGPSTSNGFYETGGFAWRTNDYGYRSDKIRFSLSSGNFVSGKIVCIKKP